MSENKNINGIVEAAALLVEAEKALPASPKVEVDHSRLPKKKNKKVEAAPELTDEEKRQATVARLQMDRMMSDKAMYEMMRRAGIPEGQNGALTQVDLARIAYKAKMDARSLSNNKRRVVNHLPFIRRQSM